MTTAIIFRDAQGITGFEISGHAGYDEEGSDIVCSAVSAVAQTMVIGLKETLLLEAQVHMEDGKLSCMLPGLLAKQARVNASILFETMRLGLNNIAEQYPEHVQVIEKEV
ncbi:MAG: ribosomal-processing cysteine protease Prp [Bacillota bacterium]